MLLEVVAENDAETIAKNEALVDVKWSLRDLAANMLRIVRGAGRGYLLGSQMVSIVEAMTRYRDITGHYPSSHEISELLCVKGEYRAETEEGACELEYGIDQAMRGGLQLAASRLLDQNAHIAAGERELLDGVRSIERAWEILRRRHGQPTAL